MDRCPLRHLEYRAGLVGAILETTARVAMIEGWSKALRLGENWRRGREKDRQYRNSRSLKLEQPPRLDNSFKLLAPKNSQATSDEIFLERVDQLETTSRSERYWISVGTEYPHHRETFGMQPTNHRKGNSRSSAMGFQFRIEGSQ